MAHGKGDTKDRKYAKPGGKQTYAQNPYGPPGSYAGNATQNFIDYKTAMPQQGFKSDQKLQEQLEKEELEKERQGKGKTLLTSKY